MRKTKRYCFNTQCNNEISSNQDYCSAECKQIDEQLLDKRLDEIEPEPKTWDDYHPTQEIEATEFEEQAVFDYEYQKAIERTKGHHKGCDCYICVHL